MSRLMFLNFEDFGLNQDITKTVQSHAMFCICCLERNVPYINLLTCSHADFLKSFAKLELISLNKVICHQCHDMLKKIKLFKLQVEDNFKLVIAEGNKAESSNQKLTNFILHKTVDISIPPANSELENQTETKPKVEIQNNYENTICKKENSFPEKDYNFEQTIVENTNNTEKTKQIPESAIINKKRKNIETALSIINKNKGDDCINLLLTSIHSIVGSDLPNNEKGLPNEAINISSDCNMPDESTDSNDSNANGTLLPVIVKVESHGAASENLAPIISQGNESPDRVEIETVKLTNEELMQERSATAASEPYLSSRHRCEHCLIGFQYKANLVDHMKRKHTPKPGIKPCDVCLQVLNPPGAHTAHTFRHYTRYGCSTCGKRFSTYDEAFQHYTREHLRKTQLHKCLQCGYSTHLKARFRDHMIMNHSRCSCKECGARFMTVQKLNTHIELMHENPAHDCVLVSQTITTQTDPVPPRETDIKHIDEEVPAQKNTEDRKKTELRKPRSLPYKLRRHLKKEQ